MKPIPQTFKRYGYVFDLIKREGWIALYSQKNKQGVVRAYEVHKIRQKERFTLQGKQSDGTIKAYHYPEQEMLAGPEDFGMYAWSYDTLAQAEVKFKEVQQWKPKPKKKSSR